LLKIKEKGELPNHQITRRNSYRQKLQTEIIDSV
jgi:hypothetical protein